MSRCILVALALVGGCETSDVDTDPFGEAPDITGRYNVIIVGTTGCDGQSELITDWAEGALSVEGDDPAALTFDFYDGAVLGGRVDEVGSYDFGGFLEYDAVTLEVASNGVAYSDGARWVLEGDLEAFQDSEDDLKDCTISGPYEAYQVGE